MGNYTVTIRGADRNTWIDFVAKCRKEKKKAWNVLSTYIKDYLKN